MGSQNPNNNNLNTNNNHNQNNNQNQKYNNNNNIFRKVAEYPLKLKSNLIDYKIGKINDIYNPQKCLLEKENNSKSFKLMEKVDNTKNTFYTGNIMSDQNSKYLIFSTKPDSDCIEIFPADNWYMFKKDINYKTINGDEAEEKIKLKPQIIEHLKNKGNNTNTKNPKKEKNKKNSDRDRDAENNNNIPQQKNLRKKNFEEDSYNDEDELFNSPKKNNKKNDSESERELTDLELREIPSDIEENFFGKSDNKKIKLFDANEELSIGKSEGDGDDGVDDSLFDDDEEDKKVNSDVEDDDDSLSEIDRKYALPDIAAIGDRDKNNFNFIGEKRNREINNENAKKLIS